MLNKKTERNLFCLLIALLFVQFWIEIFEQTLRLEDVISVLFIAIYTIRFVKNYKIKKIYSFDWIIFLFAMVLILSALNTVVNNFPIEYKKDAIINASRIIFCLLSFYLAYDLIKNNIIKIDDIVKVIIYVSLLTTSVSILQIMQMDGVLPFKLPAVLTMLKEGANVEQGRQVFGLYIGDTGSHKWSAMLSFQILVVFFSLSVEEKSHFQVFKGIYLLLLLYILFRISVRNSLLGIVISLIIVLFVNNLPKARFDLKKIFKATGILIISVLIVAGIISLLPQDNFYVQRLLSAIPQIGPDGIQINRASNIVGRLYYWNFAWSLFTDNIILGSGLYSYEHLSYEHAIMPAVHAHNSYLNYLAETGLLGFSSLLALLTVSFNKIWRLRKVPFSNKSFLIAKNVLLASFIFISFTSFFGNTLYQTPELMIRFILLGSVLAFIKYQKVYVTTKI